MFDPISVALALAHAALNSVAHFDRTPIELPCDADACVSAIAATYDSDSQCIHVTDPLTGTVLRVS